MAKLSRTEVPEGEEGASMGLTIPSKIKYNFWEAIKSMDTERLSDIKNAYTKDFYDTLRAHPILTLFFIGGLCILLWYIVREMRQTPVLRSNNRRK